MKRINLLAIELALLLSLNSYYENDNKIWRHEDNTGNIWILEVAKVGEGYSPYYLINYPILLINKIVGDQDRDTEYIININEIKLYKLDENKERKFVGKFESGKYDIHEPMFVSSPYSTLYILYLISNDRGLGKLIISNCTESSIISKKIARSSTKQTIYHYSLEITDGNILVIYSIRSSRDKDDGIYLIDLTDKLTVKYKSKISEDSVKITEDIETKYSNGVLAVRWISDIDDKKKEININIEKKN